MAPLRPPSKNWARRRCLTFAVVAAALVAVANPGVPGDVAVLASHAKGAAEDHLRTGGTPGTSAAPPGSDRAGGIARAGSPDAFALMSGRWDPCTPIHYVINDAQASAGAADDVHAAVALISDATGVEFVYDGPSSAIPTSSWSHGPYEGRPGWAPLSFTWATDAQTDLLDGWQAGSGGGDLLRGVYVTGSVVLDATYDMPAGFGPGTRGALVLHELAHAMGLDHVDDPTQNMYSSIDAGSGHLGAGDLAGLAHVGRGGGCVDTPAPSW